MIRSQRPAWSRRGMPPASRGFTLIELLVVIFIILLVSVVAIAGGAFSAYSHRQMSEAGRILQGALVGARDKAIHDGQPSGIRLLPDPAFDSIDPTTGLLVATQPLAYSRIIPIEPAPEYTEGMCTTVPPQAYGASATSPYSYPLNTQVTWSWTPLTSPNPMVLMLCQSAVQPGTGAPNSPTSWYWNVRVGDKVQIQNAGPWYTVIGPIQLANPERFVNVGNPTPLSATSGVPMLTTAVGATTVSNYVEYLLLVDGIDNNHNGYVDDGWDGVDNDGDGLFEELGGNCPVNPVMGEWEVEAWQGSLASTPAVNVPYTIRRRPMPAQGTREISLPTAVVIDATSWSSALTPVRERSRIPVDAYNGNVDIMVNPDGTVFYNSPYGAPSSFGLGDIFYHFWLAERQDVAAIPLGPTGAPVTLGGGTASYYLPIAQPDASLSANYPGPYLKGEYSVLSLNARTGQIIVNVHPPFLDGSGNYNATYPFLPAEQGFSAGR